MQSKLVQENESLNQSLNNNMMKKLVYIAENKDT